jgi:hypothetical protein
MLSSVLVVAIPLAASIAFDLVCDCRTMHADLRARPWLLCGRFSSARKSGGVCHRAGDDGLLGMCSTRDSLHLTNGIHSLAQDVDKAGALKGGRYVPPPPAASP